MAIIIQKHQEIYGNITELNHFLDDNDAIANFPAADSSSASLKFKQKIIGKTADGGIKMLK